MHTDPNTSSVAQTFAVVGMTCDHCVRAVTDELGKLDGVSNVEVDLESGTATVQSAAPLDPADVAAAIDEAGYELAS
jgi:copper ion binding protein